MDLITAKELIDSLEPLILLDCFLSVLVALFVYDAAYFFLHRLSVYLRLSRKKGGPL